MYGRHGQVLMSSSTGIADAVTSSSDHHHGLLYSSALPHNPIMNFNFDPSLGNSFSSLQPKEENGMMGFMRSNGNNYCKDHHPLQLESMSGSERFELEAGAISSGNELDMQDPDFLQPPATVPGKKKRYHRHTAVQIQEMETLFKECPHPDDKQRMRLSQELGLTPRQIKFWFQNRRTQMKAQHDRTDNVILRAENDSLKTDNYRLKSLIRSLICPACGGASLLGEVEYDEQQLRLDNARLKEELDRLCSIAARYSGRSVQPMGPPPPPGLLQPSLDLDMNVYSRNFHEPSSSIPHSGPISVPLIPPQHHPKPDHPGQFDCGMLILNEERPLAIDLALSCLDELAKLCHMDEPLWIRNINNEFPLDVLNVEEYAKMFPWTLNGKLQYNGECCRIEATRHTALVIMNSLNLVHAFLDSNKWMELFPSIVSRARTIQVLSTAGSSTATGSLYLMAAELQVLTPLVPTREAYFLRYCQHNADAGIWSIVDFPIDNFHCMSTLQTTLPRYRRRPSGCIIQDMPNGYSRVTWVEHAELIEEKPVHEIFNQYVNLGQAFGAHRWLAVLQRQCERVASQMARHISDLGVMQTPEARKNLMRLSQRMIRLFSMNISTAGGQSWTALAEAPESTVRITSRKVTEPGQPIGVILCAVSTTWLPYAHDQVFNLLKNENKRSQLEALSNGYNLQEVAHIANGSDPGNCISLLRINVATNSSQSLELMLQESCTDASGSLIVYTTVDVNNIQQVMSGEDPYSIPLLPIGFSIIPVSGESNQGGPNTSSTQGGNGCLLTVGLQVHASTIPTAKLSLSSVTAINNHLCNAVNQINASLNTNNINNNNNADVASSPVPK